MKNFFKKLLVVLFSAGAAVSLVACGNKPEDNGSGTQTGGTTNNGGNTQTGGSTNSGNNNTGNNTEDSSITVAKAIELANALEASTGKDNLHLSAESYVIKGVISGGIEAYNEQYKNATFNMKDANGTTEIVAFRLTYGDTSTKFSADTFAANIVEGKEVKVNGKLEKYQDKDGNIKLEIVNGFIVVAGGTVTPTPTPTPSPVTGDTATIKVVGTPANANNGDSLDTLLNLPAQIKSAKVTKAADDFPNKQSDVYAAKTDFRMYVHSEVTFELADGYKVSDVKVTYFVAKTNPKKGKVTIQIAEDGKSFVVVGDEVTSAIESFELVFAK